MPPMLDVQDLRTYFFTRWGVLKAVDGVSFQVYPGETFGLVGESGCGKSITCLSILRLPPQPAGRIVGGRILMNGEDLLTKSSAEMRKIRGGRIGMILQDPMSSLDPVFTIGNQINEAIREHTGLKGKRLLEKAKSMLARVHLPSPELRLRNWPHELSGGMRQRVVAAISLSCEPGLLIADEPTTSLDATIQVQLLNLLQGLQQQSNLSMIFITHDFGIVAALCHRAAVMYAGRIVESAPVRELFNNPAHPYTEALLRSVPKVEERVERLESIDGQPPPLHQLPEGCYFQPRCRKSRPECREQYPPSKEINSQHTVSCWLFE